MSNTDNAINTLIDRTLAIIDNGLERSVGDMRLMDALELVGVLMDIRERQLVYDNERSVSEPVPSCRKACVKKPKCKSTDGL